MFYGRTGLRELLSRFSLTSPVFLPGIFASAKKAPLLLSGIAGGVIGGIIEPLAISGVPLLIYGFVSAAVMWVIVAAVTGANRGQLSRQPVRI